MSDILKRFDLNTFKLAFHCLLNIAYKLCRTGFRKIKIIHACYTTLAVSGTERNSRLYLQSSAFELFLRAMALSASQNYDILPLLGVSYKTMEENKCNCETVMHSGKGRALSNYHEETTEQDRRMSRISGHGFFEHSY
jgi:hypothetical protein